MKPWIVPLLAALLTVATAQAENDKGQAKDQGQSQGQGQGQDQGKGNDNDPSNYGQVTSECNQRANSKNLEGQERKDYVEWCQSRGPRFGYDDNRYSRDRDCYRSAFEKLLSGDSRASYINRCLEDVDRRDKK